MNAISPFRLAEPGIYLDLSANQYHADPCVGPSLSQSLAKVLLDRSPAHARIRHPRLNPAFEPDDPTKYDVANIAHTLLLGRGKQIAIIQADDWRTKAAKEAREAAAAEGKLGVLEKDFSRAADMADAALRQLTDAGFAEDWAEGAGDGEAVLAWRENDLWFRAMVDWLSKDRRRVWDLKTTAASAAPFKLGVKMAEDGWDVQAAMHERALDILDPQNAGRREHLFVCQENQPPYALTIARLPESALFMGGKKLNVAIGIWADCMRTGEWPAYPSAVIVPDYPGWAETRWLDREVGEFAALLDRQPARPAPERPRRDLQDLSGAC